MSRQVPNPYHDLPEPLGLPPSDSQNFGSPLSGIGNNGGPSGGGGGGTPGGGPAKPTYAKRGKITIVACVPCRKRKTKCDGKRPACSQCAARDGTCSYDMSDDQRKLTYLRDNVEQLQNKTQSLSSLLYTVQNASDGEAAEIFRRLRTGTDIHVVAEQVQAGQLLFGVGGREAERIPPQPNRQDSLRARQLEQLTSIMSNLDDGASLDLVRRLRNQDDVSSILEDALSGRPIGQNFMQSSASVSSGPEAEYSGPEHTFAMMRSSDVNEVSKQGNASGFSESKMDHSWTSVTQDKDLIEHLLRLYFTWQHSFFQNFPEKLFRNDMEEGRTKYCSEMLVNAICAAGCFLANSDSVRAMGDRFFDEAHRHQEDIDRPDVPTTAALYLMSYVEGTRGRLSSLWMLSGRSALMSIDLGLHLRQNYLNDPKNDEETQKNETMARSHAFWGAFHVDQITSFTMGRLAVFNANSVTVDLPAVEQDQDEEMWVAYGMQLPDRPSARASTFHHCTKLSLLANSTLTMFNAPTVSLSGAALLDQYQKYKDWYEQLPSNISSTYNAPPHVICLHMYYHTAVLSLCRPFLKATIAGSNVVPREICRNAANAISDLWHQHRALYGLAGIYMFQVHCLLTACTIHIINVPTISSTRYFTHACNTFQDLLSRNEWARSCLEILRSLAEKWNLILPLEAEEALYRDVGGSRGGDFDNRSQAAESETQMRAPPTAQMLNRSTTQFPQQPHASAAGAPDGLHLPTKRSSGSDDVSQSPEVGQPKRPRFDGHAAQAQRGVGANVGVIDPAVAQGGTGLGIGASGINLNMNMGQSLSAAPLAAMGIGNSSGVQGIGPQNPPHGQPQNLPSTLPQNLPHGPPTGLPPQGLPQGRTIPTIQQRAAQAQSASDYLYSPLVNQPPPLLTPVKGNTSAAVRAIQATTRNVQQQRSEAARGHAASKGKEPARHGGNAKPKQEQQDSEVDGLSFRDDWRDPFMGYNAQE